MSIDMFIGIIVGMISFYLLDKLTNWMISPLIELERGKKG